MRSDCSPGPISIVGRVGASAKNPPRRVAVLAVVVQRGCRLQTIDLRRQHVSRVTVVVLLDVAA